MRTIIGVIDEYMATPPIFNSFPMIMRLQTRGNNYLLVRYKPGQNVEAQSAIQAGLSTLNPGYPVDIGDIDDEYAEDAKDFIKAANIFSFITIIAIVNVIVGLFGLSIFMADKRKKEIGIRKTFGASVFSLMKLMFGNCLVMFCIAFGIASPIAYFLGIQYLKIFSLKVSLTADLFLLSGLWAMLIILISVGWKLYLSANRNPVDTLRYE
jgi:ABC-type antimicrobial peptide transport system permease subunit